MIAAGAEDQSRQAGSLACLTPFGWTGGLLVTLGGLIVSFFLSGFWMPYWRIADQDIILLYDAFLQNSGLTREIAISPAHLSVTLLGWTLRALHSFGLAVSYSIATVPPASDPVAFTHGWTVNVRVVRLFSLATVLAYVTAFAFLLRRFIGDWRAALLGAFALAFSGGAAMSVRSLKPDLLAAALVTIGLIILLIAARSPRLAARPALVGLAALCSTLAVSNKLLAIFLICAMPVLALAFGESAPAMGDWWRSRRGCGAACVAVLAALAAAWFAYPLLAEGLRAPLEQRFSTAIPLLRMIGLFDVLIAGWVIAGILVFAAVWRVSPAETIATSAAVVIGTALGLLALYLPYQPPVVVATTTPLDTLLGLAAASARASPDCGLACLLGRAPSMIYEMFRHHTFIFRTSSRASHFLEWCVIAGCVVVFRRGEKRLALQCALLIATAVFIDTLLAARSLKQDYYNFGDPPIIIATALMLAYLDRQPAKPWIYPAGAVLIALHVAFSQAEPIKHAWLMRSGPQETCNYLEGMPRLGHFPFCAGGKFGPG